MFDRSRVQTDWTKKQKRLHKGVMSCEIHVHRPGGREFLFLKADSQHRRIVHHAQHCASCAMLQLLSGTLMPKLTSNNNVAGQSIMHHSCCVQYTPCSESSMERPVGE